MNFPRICALNVLLCLPLLACAADKGETETDTAASLTDATTSGGTGTTAGDTGTTAAETTATATDTTTTQPTTGDDTTGDDTTGSVTTVTTGDDTTGDDTTGDDSTGGDDTTGDDTTGGDTSTGEPAGLSWALDIHPIAVANSCGCHAEGIGGLKMTNAMDSYAILVGVQSHQSGLKRVEPGDPEASYLLHKLRGTQDKVGGKGLNMPAGGDSLPDATLDLVAQWILEGAKP